MDKITKTLLIYPPSRGGVQIHQTFHKDEGIGFKPPLGIMVLSTYLRQHGYSADCLDANTDRLSIDDIVRHIDKHDYGLVGITTWTDFWYPVWKLVRAIKHQCKKTKIVLGGPHCFVYPKESLLYSEADYVIAGDGEEPLLHLVKSLQSNNELGDCKGLWYKTTNGEVFQPTIKIATISNPSIIPTPDRSLLLHTKYSSVIGKSEYETTMVTSRGCPHNCIFCKMHSQKISIRPAEAIVDEFEQIYKMGIHDIQVYDDTFTWSKKRVHEICDGIIKRGINVRWAIRDRVNRADPEMYKKLRKAGCYRIHFGVETGDPEILLNSGKGITLQQALLAVRTAKESSMETMAFFMFGFMGETHEQARKTLDFALTLDPDYAVFHALIPYPGTRLYNDALARGIISHDFWLEFVKKPSENFVLPSLVEDGLSKKEIFAWKSLAQRRFYFRPRRIWNELKKVKSPAMLIKRAGMAIRLLWD